MAEVNTGENKSLTMLFLFFALLFLLNAYDLFFLLEPVRGEGLGKEPTLGVYVVANFFPKVIFYLAKFVAVALLLWAGIMILNLYTRAEHTFKDLFQFVVKLELILLSGKLLKIVYLTFVDNDYTFDEYMQFYPLSLHKKILIDYPLMQKILIDLSLFDVVYMVVMAVGLHQNFIVTARKSIVLVSVCYLLPLLIFDWFLFYIGFS